MAATKFELSDTTPSAPPGFRNVSWQIDGIGNVSANLPVHGTAAQVQLFDGGPAVAGNLVVFDANGNLTDSGGSGGEGGNGSVFSVFGRTGVVIAQAGDYNAAQVTFAADTRVPYADPPWIQSLAWDKITGAPLTGVASVFGRTGAVVAANGDYTAAMVTDAVSALGSYADPPWITELAWGKITGAPATGVGSVFGRQGAILAQTGDYTAAMVTDAVSTLGSYPDPPWITSLAWDKITGAPIGANQTPWLSNINAAGFNLNALTTINFGPGGFLSSSTASLALVANNAPSQGVTLGAVGLIQLQGANVVIQGISSTGGVSLQTSSPAVERLLITPAGRVGISVVNPVFTLDVGGDCNITGEYMVNQVPIVTGVSSVFARSGNVVATAGDYTAAMVTGAVDQGGSYPNPSWITSLAWSKITGAPPTGQSPWLSNINAALYNLDNCGAIGLGTMASPANGLIYAASNVLPSLATVSASATGGASIRFQNDAGSILIVGVNGSANSLVPNTANFNTSAAGFTFNMTNAERVRINTTGLGVGVSPAYPIDCSGDCNITGVYRVNGVPIDTGGGGQNQTPWLSNIDGGNFALNNVNQIGIGATAPAAVGLYFNAPNAGWDSIRCNSTFATGYSSVRVTNTTAGDLYLISFGTGAAFPSTSGLYQNISTIPIAFWIGGQERMRITPAGNVGIGTPSPSSPLEIRSASTQVHVSSLDGGQVYLQAGTSGNATNLQILTDQSSTVGVSIGNALPGYPVTNDLVFGTLAGSWAERMRITAAGNVGIGTANPSHPLDVVGSCNVTGQYLVNGLPAISSAGQFVSGAGVDMRAECACSGYAVYDVGGVRHGGYNGTLATPGGGSVSVINGLVVALVAVQEIL